MANGERLNQSEIGPGEIVGMQNSAEQSGLKKRYIISQPLVDKFIDYKFGDPDYPLKGGTLEATYIGYKEELSHFERKYGIARSFLEDGRYKDLRFFAREFLPEGVQLPDEERAKVVALHEEIKLLTRQALLKRGDLEETKAAKEDLVDFSKKVADNNTPDAAQFRKFIDVFGPSRAILLLYRLHPEFRGLPIEQVRSILGEYLGDTLSTRGSFNPANVEIALPLLEDPSLRGAFYENMKLKCYDHVQFVRRMKYPQDFMYSVEEYLEIMRLEFSNFFNEHLEEVLSRVRTYYTEAFSMKKPDRMVNSLREDRLFPDTNQMINKKEIEDKKRILIADEMGLGKSASAIVAKEALGVKQALVVVPSNVVPTWQEYLSDKVEENQNGQQNGNGGKKQKGYFKEGQAPKVLTVEHPMDLERADINDFEYIILSHERLNEWYTTPLTKLPYGMLIVDEVHKLKNIVNGEWAGNLVRLSDKAEIEDSYVVLLSGTPVPNKVQDLAMILKLLYPEKYKDISDRALVKSIVNNEISNIDELLVPGMQMKRLGESLNLPELTEETEWLELSPIEKQLYETILEDDELEPTEKMKILRQFLLNPEMLDVTPGIMGTKLQALSRRLQKVFVEDNKSKMVLFVNDFVENIIRGDKNIFNNIIVPAGVDLEIIAGGVEKDDRVRIQKELKNPDSKTLVVVSGQTADVGVDFSGAEVLDFYNEPWTNFMKRQQLGRGYREGLTHPLSSKTFLVRGAIEEGIHAYVLLKQRAIEKLINGVPISEADQRIVIQDEEKGDPDLSVNPELAHYYFSSWDLLTKKIFPYVKEQGEEKFLQFIEQYGKEYADCYMDLGSRSYQANACRLSAAMIDGFIKSEGKQGADIRILDIASGPEMLRRHSQEEHQDKITSIDINKLHFSQPGERRAVGSFLNLPVKSDSIDYANFSLAIHYSSFAPSKGRYERLVALAELSRVLKVGGKAVVNLIYTLEFKDLEKFEKVINALGCRVNKSESGFATSGDAFKAHVLTIEKISESGEFSKETEDGQLEYDVHALEDAVGRQNLDGLKFKNKLDKLKDSRWIITDCKVGDRNIQIDLNQEDQRIFEEEQAVKQEADSLIARYGSVSKIPRSEVINNNFIRYFSGKSYVLFKRLTMGPGAVVIK